MRFLRRITSFLCAALAAPSAVMAAGFPDHAITIIIPFAPGGLADSLSRVLGKGLTEKLGQPVIVESKSGAGGILALQALKTSRPDGHTIALGSISTISLSPLVNSSLPFDITRDFAPVAMTFLGKNVVVVPASSKVDSLKSLATEALAKHGAMNYATAGNGTTQHLLGALFAKLSGASMTSVPYRGTSPALVATMSGESDVMFAAMDALPFIESGKLRAIAAASAERVKGLPNVPTSAEAGMPSLVLDSFYGVLAPAGTPAKTIETLNRAIAEVLGEPETIRSLDFFHVAAAPDTSPAYFARTITSEAVRWKKFVEENHLSLR